MCGQVTQIYITLNDGKICNMSQNTKVDKKKRTSVPYHLDVLVSGNYKSNNLPSVLSR